MKNKKLYMEYFLFGVRFLLHYFVALIFISFILAGTVGMLHIFFVHQSLLETSDYMTEAGDFIFVPLINLLKKIIVITIGNDFENSKIDYMSVYGFGMLFIGVVGLRIYLKFFDKE